MPPLEITAPEPLRVVQRSRLAPRLGSAVVRVAGTGAPPGVIDAEVRAAPCPEGYGDGTPWTRSDVDVAADGTFETAATVAGGGWYRVEVRLLGADGVLAEAFVEPVGVGEVFVVAGQSYACSCHEAVTTVADPTGRVVAQSPEQPGWRVAHDPQPGIKDRVDAQTMAELMEMLDGLDLRYPFGDRSPYLGSIWPTFGDHLVDLLGVPVAMVNVAVGGTLVRHWQPGGQLWTNVCDAVRLAGDHRAVLWQQGESDAAEKTPPEEYVAALVGLREAVVAATGQDRPWLPAKSTHHPTGERPPELELPIRAAVDEVWRLPGFAPGPDTDRLRGPDYRAGWWRGAHFTGKGQRAAGLMWAAAVHDLIGGQA